MPDISMVVSLAKTLNVSTDYLFGLEKNEIDDNVYVELKRHIEKIETESGRKAEAALLSCQFMLKKVYEAPDNYIYSVFFVEQVANLSRFVDLEKYAEDKWAEYRELAIKYGSNAIRFANNKEWIERAHFALAWIYIHDRNYAYAREHIEQLPSVSSNRLQESILAQLEAFENGIDAMDEAVTKNLQNFVRAINKENLYAMETFSWQKPLRAVEFGQWAIRLIEVFGENKYLKSYCRGFLRDIYKYLINAEVILGRFENAAKYFEELKEIKPDALIISDPGVFMIAKEVCPDIDRHISTQANSTNYATYKFWYDQGASRVVSARELSLEEIKDIRAHIPDDMEIESFIHGAMCISHSGRCLLSNYFTGRNANSGECTHPCRWKYSVMEQTRPGEYMPVYENERGTYIFNSKDLNMIEYIDQILDAGIDSLKIEGRMKTALYVATVARTYRKAIDDCKESVEKYRANMDYYKEEIAKCTYRQFTTGFYFGKTDETSQIYDSNTYIKNCTYIGIVQGHNDKGYALLEQKNKFSVGETIEVMIPDGTNKEVIVKAIEDEDGRPMESAPHPKQMIYVDFGEEIKEGYLLRRREEVEEEN